MTGDAGMVAVGDGVRLAFRFDGPSEAPVLMLSHSLGTDSEMWGPQVLALRDRFRILRYDARGHGRSDAPSGAYGMDRLGRDAIELLDALGVARAAFCGVSMGGMVGQWLGARAPERLSALVLANTSACMGASGWQSRIDQVLTQGVQSVADEVIKRWFTNAFIARDPETVARTRATLAATTAQGYAGCSCAIRDMDQRPTAALIRTPTLVIGGSHDVATPPEHARFLAGAIGPSEYLELDAAHLSNLEAAEAFNQGVGRFLDASL